MDNPFIGQMDRKIQLVQKVKTQTSTGSEVSSEAVMASPFAYMKDMSGGEEVDGKVKHLVARTYTIRFNQEIKTTYLFCYRRREDEKNTVPKTCLIPILQTAASAARHEPFEI